MTRADYERSILALIAKIDAELIKLAAIADRRQK
jgi:hypothetical protein